MANLIRRHPYPRDAYNMSQYLDRFFDLDRDFFDPMPFSFPLDVIEKDKEYLVRANVAGFDSDQIEITYDNNTLTIRGEVKEENVDEKEGRYHVRERRYGSFCRSVSLPGMVEQSEISAESENGTLTVHLPKKPEAQPKRIEVKPKSVDVVD
ncbi:MAG: Hsp20/alpha crystallin family protein [Anaerolineaceae bacterium]